MQSPMKKSSCYFSCVRRVVMDGHGSDVDGGKGDYVLDYITLGHTDGVVCAPIYLAVPPPLSPAEKDVTSYRKKKSPKKFLRAAKAVFFETSLAKKIKELTSETKLRYHKGSKTLAGGEKKLSPQKFPKKIDGKDVYKKSSAWQSSSRANSLGSCNSIEFKKKRDVAQENGQGIFSSITGLLLLLVILLVLVFWGKIYAIFCTSTWLLCVPNQNLEKKLLGRNHLHSMHLEAYKKKIIMEGVLEKRHHSRVP